MDDHDPTLPYPMTCRKCGTRADGPQYFVTANDRPYLLWRCGALGDCGYTWTQRIYRDPETEWRLLRERVKDLERTMGAMSE